MKRVLAFLFSSLLLVVLTPKIAHAAVSCPSSYMSCQELNAQGGCASGCVNITTGGGNGPTYCHCEVLSSQTGLACGSQCQTGAQCGSDCPFCRAAGPGANPTCQTEQASLEGLGSLGCDFDTGIQTAIGCLHVLNPGGLEVFLGELLKWGAGVGGGIAFLLIVYASFMIMTSQGNPERLKAGQDLLVSAISGLILLILSVFVLNVIGVKILKIPGFGP